MTPDRWPDIERVFLQALDTPAPERAARVRTLCGDDDALFAEVVALLDTEHEAAAFFDGHSGLSTLLAEATGGRSGAGGLEPGTRLGPWALREEAGRGGMGTVYRAERADGLFAQTAAVKLVNRGMDTDVVLRRFHRERAALAGLSHPHIAQLFDGGTAPDGRPYFVMEFVDGVPLTEYADARRLSVDDRLRLFLQACAAVAHAHRNLIVHRDLKPSNILVTSAGTVKLLDFGLAKLLDDDAASSAAPLTREGPRLLTPEYAAPEQIDGGPITTAIDVYALGAVLYELLSGARPYDFPTRSVTDIERVIREIEPTRPSQKVSAETAASRGGTAERLCQQLHGDLDTVCLQALRKERGARYPTVEALAADIERHLAGLPIEARAHSAVYRLAKYARRHRVGVGVATLLVLVLVGFTAALGVQRREALRERDKARTVAAFLEGLFLEVDVGSGRGSSYTVRDALDEGAQRVAELEAQPEVQAHMLDVMGRVYRALGLYDRARPLHEEAVRLSEAALGPDHPETLAAQHHLAYLLDQQNETAAAEALYRRVLAERRRMDDPDGLLESTSDLANLLVADNRPDEAVALIHEGLLVLEHHPDAGPPDQNGPLARASFLYLLGKVEVRQGRVEAGERHIREARALYHAQLGPDHVYTVSVGSGLARVLIVQDREAEAEALLAHAHQTFLREWGPGHPWTLAAARQRADLLQKQDRLGEALALIDEALAGLTGHKDLDPDAVDGLVAHRANLQAALQ